MAGKRNIVFGFSYLFFTLALSLYLIGSSQGLAGVRSENISNALIQADIDSVLNILAGYLIRRLSFVDWLARVISPLMIAGALLHSGILYLACFGLLPLALTLLMPVGSFILIAVTLFMGIGLLSLRAVR